jgi:hypothetical protein
VKSWNGQTAYLLVVRQGHDVKSWNGQTAYLLVVRQGHDLVEAVLLETVLFSCLLVIGVLLQLEILLEL